MLHKCILCVHKFINAYFNTLSMLSIKISVSTVSSSEDVVEAGSLTKQRCMPNKDTKKKVSKTNQKRYSAINQSSSPGRQEKLWRKKVSLELSKKGGCRVRHAKTQRQWIPYCRSRKKRKNGVQLMIWCKELLKDVYQKVASFEKEHECEEDQLGKTVLCGGEF